MFVSDAMMIPKSALGVSLKQADAGNAPRVNGSPWVGPSWPLAGTSLGRQSATHFGAGTSPFGKSVDMVDWCTQVMEGAAQLILALHTLTVALTSLIRPSPPMSILCRYSPGCLSPLLLAGAGQSKL
jgi:hypothetical protein